LGDERARVGKAEGWAECVERDHGPPSSCLALARPYRKLQTNWRVLLDDGTKKGRGRRPTACGRKIVRKILFLGGRLLHSHQGGAVGGDDVVARCHPRKAPRAGDAAAVGAVDHDRLAGTDGLDLLAGAEVDADG